MVLAPPVGFSTVPPLGSEKPWLCRHHGLKRASAQICHPEPPCHEGSAFLLAGPGAGGQHSQKPFGAPREQFARHTRALSPAVCENRDSRASHRRAKHPTSESGA